MWVLVEEKFLDDPDRKEVEKLLRLSGTPTPTGSSGADSENPRMVQVYDTASRVALSDSTILILGESGVGKTRLARQIHEKSPRRNGPFITVSCGSIPETLLESELFGVEKGAFTGAHKSREGRFLAASGGTIFLDEIGELTLPLQVKLLRVIQERKIEPLGSGKEMEVDVRLIAATNRNLEADVKEGRFRGDLYFRLHVVPLEMPPLRDRKEDIIPLAKLFLEKKQKDESIHCSLSPQVPEILLAYHWPGNIRELENCMERMAVLSRDGVLRPEDFPPRILQDIRYKPGAKIQKLSSAREQELERQSEERKESECEEVFRSESGDYPTIREIEKRLIRRVLESTGGNVQKAAAILDIHRNTLSRKIDELGLNGKK